jgi:hypothetical protein
MVIGYIEKFMGKNARVKVLAFKDKNEWIKGNDRIVEAFGPSGNVFEDSFTVKYPEYRETDVIFFSAIENPQSVNDPTKDSLKIEFVKEKLFYQIYTIKQNINNDNFSLNYSLIQEFYNSVPDKFFLKSNSGIYGPFKKSDNRIIPNTGKTVNFYDSIDNYLVSYNNNEYVIEDPQNSKYQVDFSSDEQLTLWFKTLLKTTSSFDEKSFNYINDYIKKGEIQDDNLSKSKLIRIQKLFSKIEFTFVELKYLLVLVPDLKAVISDKISSFKNEILLDSKSEIEVELNLFRSKAAAEKESIKNQIQNLKKQLNNDSKLEKLEKIANDLNQKNLDTLIGFLNSQGKIIENKKSTQVDLECQLLLYKKFGNAKNGDIKEAKKELEKIQAEIEKAKNDFDVLNSKINYLTENRDTVIRDMQLFLDITRPTTVIAQAIQIPNSYIIEEILSQQSDHLSDVDFAHNFIHNLQKRNKAADIKFQELKKIISSFKCIFTSNLEVILAFIEATNNAIYTIIQIEPKWLSFKDLVDNGLKELWLSAFENPDVLHFAILRDVNLSSPECYANPLIDLDRNLRTKLPFIEKAWPPNLRIIGTIQPVPEVGLSVLKSTFDNWGGLPTYGLQFTSVNPSEYKEQALQVTNFNTWICDRDDINNYLDQYIS